MRVLDLEKVKRRKEKKKKMRDNDGSLVDGELGQALKGPGCAALRLVCSSDETDLGKGLLNELSSGSPLTLYRSYMRDTVSFNVSRRCVSLLDDSMLARFYMLEQPEASPKYFNFFYGNDLAKLEKIWGGRLLVLMRGAAEGSWFKLYDYGIYHEIERELSSQAVSAARDTVAGEEEEEEDSSDCSDLDQVEASVSKGGRLSVALEAQRLRVKAACLAQSAALGRQANMELSLSKEPTVFVVDRDREGNRWRLYSCAAGRLGSLRYRPLFSEVEFYRRPRMTSFDGGCFLSRVAMAVGKISLPADHVHSRSCETISGLLSNPGVTSEITKKVGSFVVATHLRTIARPVSRHMAKACNNLFGILFVFGGPASPESLVVCVTADKDAYLLEPAFAKKVVSNKLSRLGRDAPRQKFPAPADWLGKVAPHSSVAAKKVAGIALEGNLVEAATALSTRTYAGCPCEPCISCRDFDYNMSACGPQRLYKSDLGLVDLLKVVGRHDAETEAALLAAGDLSVASFDVESSGRRLDCSVGNEDAAFPVPVGQPDTRHLPREVYAVHEPVLVGFSDHLMLQQGEETIVLEVIEGDGDERHLEGRFLDLVFERRELAVKEKFRLLAPLLDWLAAYRIAHFSFFSSKGDIPSCWVEPSRPIDPEAETAAAVSAFLSAGRLVEADDEVDVELEEVALEAMKELASELGRGSVSPVNSEDSDEDFDSSIPPPRMLGADPWIASRKQARRKKTPSFGRKERSISIRSSMSSSSSSATFNFSDLVIMANPKKSKRAKKEKMSQAEKLRLAAAKQRHRQLEVAWRHSILGMLELRVRRLACCYNVYGFNAEVCCLLTLA